MDFDRFLEDLAGDRGASYSDPIMTSTEDWVDQFFVSHCMRVGARWCPRWTSHPQARFALEVLFRSFEEAKASDEINSGGQSTMNWYVGHFRPVVEDLTHIDGPFARCDQSHCDGPSALGNAVDVKPHVWADWTVSDRQELLSEIIFGQDAAVREVATLLTVRASGLQLRPKRPAGLFLFAGPSGCGKTELAHAIAEVEFGERSHVIRLDLGEYSHPSDVARLTGSAPGYMGNDQPEGWLTTRVLERPASVLLLDEVEKADKSVFDVLLGAFDVGRLTDGRGRTADFTDTIVVMTSNLGSAAYLRADTGFGRGERCENGARRAVIREIETHFRPEFLGRLDTIVQFDPINKEATLSIIARELDLLSERLHRAGWNVRWAPSLTQQIANIVVRPEYGARQIHRTIERVVLAEIVQMPKGSFEFPSEELTAHA